MIDHRRALTLAATAIDFPLGTADRDLLDAHVGACASCRAELAGFRRDAARLAALPPIAPPAWVRDRIGRSRRSNPFVLLAAAALLLAASGLALVIAGGILRDRTALVVPTSQPSGPHVTPSPHTSPTPFIPTPPPASFGPTAILAGQLLVRRTDPASTEPVPVSFGLIDVAGGGYRSLGVAVDAALSADGSRVHLVLEDASCTPRLVTVDLQGVEVGRIEGGFRPGDGPFAWSPGDDRLVFGRYVSGEPDGMCHSQGGAYAAAELLSATYVIDASNAWAVGTPLIAGSAPARYGWSPDGRSISVADPSPRLSVIDAGSGAVTDLRPALASIGAADLWEARWAPDGKSIAFVYSSGVGDMVGLATLAGETARTVGQYGNVTNVLGWSPDGRSIAAVRGIKGGYLVLLGADGVTDEVLLEQAEVDQDAPFGWSPDGSWLACTFLDGELGAISADGIDVKPIFVPPAGSSVQFVGWSRG